MGQCRLPFHRVPRPGEERVRDVLAARELSAAQRLFDFRAFQSASLRRSEVKGLAMTSRKP